MIIRFLHHGMAVSNLDQALKFYKAQGFKVTQEFERDDLFAKAAHLEHEGGVLELWEFTKPHPQHDFIKKHAALETDDLDNDLKVFERNGFKIVIPITQGKILRYAFVADEAGNNIELGERL